MAVNPYLVGGLSEGVERGLGIYRSFDDIRRQKQLDAERAEDRVSAQELRGLQIQQAQQGLEQGRFALEQARRQRALQSDLDTARKQAEEDRQYTLDKRQADLEAVQAQIDASKALGTKRRFEVDELRRMRDDQERERRVWEEYLTSVTSPETIAAAERVAAGQGTPEDRKTVLNTATAPERYARAGQKLQWKDASTVQKNEFLSQNFMKVADSGKFKGAVVPITQEEMAKRIDALSKALESVPANQKPTIQQQLDRAVQAFPEIVRRNQVGMRFRPDQLVFTEDVPDIEEALDTGDGRVLPVMNVRFLGPEGLSFSYKAPPTKNMETGDDAEIVAPTAQEMAARVQEVASLGQDVAPVVAAVQQGRASPDALNPENMKNLIFARAMQKGDIRTAASLLRTMAPKQQQISFKEAADAYQNGVIDAATFQQITGIQPQALADPFGGLGGSRADPVLFEQADSIANKYLRD